MSRKPKRPFTTPLRLQSLPKHLAMKFGYPRIMDLCDTKRRNRGCPLCGSANVQFRSTTRDVVCHHCGAVTKARARF
jgi:NADH pyrophosphatase NudC (nudix superfamily)